MKFNYPTIKRGDVVDTFKSTKNGEVKVADPYRSLEDPNSEVTKNWITEENKLTKSFLTPDESDKTTDSITNELMKRLNFERVGWIRRRGSRLFFSKNPGTLNQEIIYYIDISKIKVDPNGSGKDSAIGFEHATEFLNPNTYSKDGTWSLKSFVISKSGNKVVYSYSKAGSDWEEIGVKRIEDDGITVSDYTDHINWCKFTTIKWDKNETGFIYNRYPKPSNVSDETKGTETDANLNNKIYYHRLGDKDEEHDKLIYQCPEHPSWLFSADFSNDFKTLLISIHKDCNPENNFDIIRNFNEIILQGQPGELKVEKLIENFNASYHYIENQGDNYYFLSNLQAPYNRLISIDIGDGSNELKQEQLVIKEIIPQKDKCVLEDVNVSSENKFYASYQKDVQDIIQVFDYSGKYLKDIQLPGPGSASLVAAPFHNHVFITFTSLVSPSSIYYLDSKDDKLVLLKEPHIEGFRSSDYVCKQVFYESPKDKTKIPMFIAHHVNNYKKDGNSCVYMTAYGGFNVTYSQTFSLKNIFFMDKFNGAFVIANIRGGGEYGIEWHNGGRLANKQNCFDDFVGAAQYLIDEGYTNANKLAVRGGSNGGLLMGAVSNQRPDLFKCVVSDVGVHDMLRFHKFTIGGHWCSDYGKSDDPTDFDTLISYSPYHNVPVSATQYPSIMLLCADHDDRVVPFHSYKFAAELQHQLGSKVDTPLLIKIDTDSGHGAGKSLTKQNTEVAEVYNFFSKVLNHKLTF